MHTHRAYCAVDSTKKYITHFQEVIIPISICQHISNGKYRKHTDTLSSTRKIPLLIFHFWAITNRFTLITLFGSWNMLYAEIWSTRWNERIRSRMSSIQKWILKLLTAYGMRGKVWDWDREYSRSMFVNVLNDWWPTRTCQLVVEAKRIKYWCCAEFWCVIGFDAGVPSEVSNGN